jgi:hypothetical protein
MESTMSGIYAGGWYVTTRSVRVSSDKWRTSDEATSRANGVKPKAKPKAKPTRKRVKAKKSQVRGAVGAGVLTVREIELLARQEKYAEKQKAERVKQVGDYL